MPGKGTTLTLITLGCVLFLMKPTGSRAGNEEALNPKDLVAAHVRSLGDPETVAKKQSRTFIGTSEVKLIQGGNWTLKGNSMFLSQGPSLGIVLSYGDVNYPGEYFAYDGESVTVKHISPGRKSPVADFLYRFDTIMKQGLLGGALSASWQLLFEARTADAQMKSRRVELEGRELYALEYRPRNNVGNMKVEMFFEPDTFRHVRTEYRVQDRDDATVGYNYLESAMTHIGDIGRAREDSYYRLVEKFDDYRKVGGMILPHRYVLEYSQEGGAGSFIAHWTMNARVWAFNPVLDEKLFQAEK